MPAKIEDVDQKKLEELQGKVIGDVADSMGVLFAYMGDQLNLYSALAQICPATSEELAARTTLTERYVREWLSANAAGGYIEYDPGSQKFSMTPEQALLFAAEGHPACMQGFFQSVVSVYADEPKATKVFRTGEGIPWADHSACLFCGTDLIESWIPALDGVQERLEAGARVADIGCGHGSSTIIMAQSFPNSTFHGFDFHRPSIEHAKQRASDAGVEGNTVFEVAAAKDYPGAGYDLLMRKMMNGGFTVDEVLADDAKLQGWIDEAVYGSWHVGGTCRMGAAGDPLAVVDPAGCVIGVDGVRIADASIMPTPIRATTNLTAIMIGEKLADAILAGQTET
jgi:choline dehydrogenase-like flavoprotein